MLKRIGCRNSSRDLFKELQQNNFTHVLSIPMIKNGSISTTSTHSNKYIDIPHHNDLKDNGGGIISSSSHSPSMSDYNENIIRDPDHFDNVSSIVAPNAPPSYRNKS